MSEIITLETIRAAQGGDETAAEMLIRAMDDRLSAMAFTEAKRMTSGDVQQWADEFKQVGQIAVWEYMPNFTEGDVDSFYAFASKTARAKISEAAMMERGHGADPDALKTFGYWVKQTDGDIDLAEKLSQRLPDASGKKLGRDRANAARLAWQSSVSLSVSYTGNDDGDDDSSFANTLASNLGIPEEFLEPRDFDAAQRHATTEMVRAVLDVMGEGQANVLRGTFGITPFGHFGADDNDNLGALLGLTAKQVIDARKKGKLSFAKRWVPLVSKGSADVAQAWWDAFETERQRGNASTTARRAKAATA
jgi:hypothetical protein